MPSSLGSLSYVCFPFSCALVLARRLRHKSPKSRTITEMAPSPPTTLAMTGVFDDDPDDVGPPSRGELNVGTLAAEDKEVEVTSKGVADRVTPLLVGVMKTEDVISIVTGARLDVGVGDVRGLTSFDDAGAAASPDVVGEAGEVCCEVELGDCDVGAAWLALCVEVAALWLLLSVVEAGADGAALDFNDPA